MSKRVKSRSIVEAARELRVVAREIAALGNAGVKSNYLNRLVRALKLDNFDVETNAAWFFNVGAVDYSFGKLWIPERKITQREIRKFADWLKGHYNKA